MKQPVVIVLAAGRGERYTRSGGTVHKLDARLAGTPLLQHVLNTVQASGLPCHVVYPRHEEQGRTDGMGDSIARGVAATAQAAGWLILPGDLPLVGTQSLLAVAAGLLQQPVVVPYWQGQQGHPVGFHRSCGPALMALTGDTGAAAVVRQHRQTGAVLELNLDDPGITMDIDTLDDLATAEAFLASSNITSGNKHGER